MRRWIDDAQKQVFQELTDRLRLVVDVPIDAKIQAIAIPGHPLSTPSNLLSYETSLRELNSNHLIEPYSLNWLFLNRSTLRPSDEQILLLIASALRRSSTLYWWLTIADKKQDLIAKELFAAVEAEDRDKSDAARSIVDVGSIYLADDQMHQLLKVLKSSKYAHFKSAARGWRNKETQTRKIERRIAKATFEQQVLTKLGVPELQLLSDQLASKLLREKNQIVPRRLADVNLVAWAKLTGRLKDAS